MNFIKQYLDSTSKIFKWRRQFGSKDLDIMLQYSMISKSFNQIAYVNYVKNLCRDVITFK